MTGIPYGTFWMTHGAAARRRRKAVGGTVAIGAALTLRACGRAWSGKRSDLV